MNKKFLCKTGYHMEKKVHLEFILTTEVVQITISSQNHVHVTYAPSNPTFYVVKFGIYRGIHIFVIFIQNIDCGYSLEPPRGVPTINVLSKKKSQFFN